MKTEKQADQHAGQRQKHFYFLDGQKIESDMANISGASVRAHLPAAKAGYTINLEAHGNEPDPQVTDSMTFSLEKTPLHFYSVPPANFGQA